MIRHSIFIILSTWILSGCVNQSLWYKEGVQNARVEDQATNCQVKAARQVPANTQLGVTPAYTTPTQTSCYAGYGGYVSCNTTGGQTYGGNAYSYDANTGLRNKVIQQCMSRAGYTAIELPTCTSNAAKLMAQTQRRQPKLTETSCVIEIAGQLRIVNE